MLLARGIPHHRSLLLGIMLYSLLLGFALAKPVFAASPGDILIVEVGADPASAAGIAEPAGEYIEIRNVTGATINLSGWTLNDNSNTTITLPNTDLGAGKVLVIIADTTTFNASNYNCTANPLSFSPASWFTNNLANGNDNVVLRDNTSTIIDAVSYGTDTTAFNPPAADVFNNSGATLQRVGYNNGPYTDTNTAADWQGSTGAGTPCDVSPTAVSLRQLNANSLNGVKPAVSLGLLIALLLGTFYILGWRKA